jgi:hypothetical protein
MRGLVAVVCLMASLGGCGGGSTADGDPEDGGVAGDSGAPPDASGDAQDALGDAGADAPGDAGDGPGPDVGLPAFASGARLQARYAVFDDGLRRFDGWFDTEVGQPCERKVAEDGRERCLPALPYLIPFIAYSDAECTQEVLPHVTEACDHPDLVRVRNYGAPGVECEPSARYEVFEYGAEVEVEAYWQLVDDGCTDLATDPEAVNRIRAYTPIKWDPTSFVAVEDRVTDSGERIEAVVEQWEDGAHRIVGAFDRELELPVRPSLSSDDVERWLPATTGHADYYLDSECSTRVAFVNEHPCDAHERFDGAGVGHSRGMCQPSASAIHLLGETIFPEEVHLGLGDLCMPFSPPSSGTWHTLGDEVATDTFVPVTWIEQGSRLRSEVAVNGAGLELHPRDAVIDTAYGDRVCTPERVAEDAWRCFPKTIGMGRQDYYADPECTENLVGFREPGTCAVRAEFVITYTPPRCERHASLHSLGEAYGGPFYWVGTEGCEPVPEWALDTIEALNLHELGDPVDLDDLAEVTFVTD